MVTVDGPSAANVASFAAVFARCSRCFIVLNVPMVSMRPTTSSEVESATPMRREKSMPSFSARKATSAVSASRRSAFECCFRMLMSMLGREDGKGYGSDRNKEEKKEEGRRREQRKVEQTG